MTVANRHNSIPWLLICVFFILVICIISTGSYYYFTKGEEIKEGVQNNLAAIAELKIGEITGWQKERKGDALQLQNSIAVARLVKNYFDTETQGKELRRWLVPFCEHNGYSSATLLDTSGAVRFAYGEGAKEIDGPIKQLLSKVLKERKNALKDLYISPVTKKPTIDLLVPIILWDRKDLPVAGAFLFRLDPSQVLYPLIQSWPTPSPTAETLLVRREGDEVVYLSELRHRKGTVLTFRLPITEKNLPAAMAARGEEGLVEGIDYRGVPVLAAILKVPDSPWFMIAKIDRSEIYDPLHHELLLVSIVTALLMIASGALLGFWWRNQRAAFYRKQYEAELERQALVKHLDYLVKYANDMIFLFDGEGRIVEVNDQVCVKYGYLREELLKMRIGDLLSPEERAGMADLLNRIAEKDRQVYETVHFQKDGTSFPAEISAHSFDIEGKRYVQAIVRDITERRYAEELLRESEGKFRIFAEQSIVGIAIVQDGLFKYVNPKFAEMSGYGIDELLDGMPVQNLVHPDDRAMREELRQRRLLTAGSADRSEFRQVRKNGEIADIEIYASRVLFNNMPASLGIMSDVTERKRTQKDLFAEKELLGVTLRSIGDGVITTDTCGKITLLNKVAEELTGWSFAEAMGLPLPEVLHIIHEHTRERCENPVEKVLQTRAIAGLARHTALIRRDGNEIAIADSGAPILDREGNVVGVVLVFRDITDKKRTRLALQNADKLEAIGTLAGGIAHDFNNLLSGIFGYLDLARLHAKQGDGKASEQALEKAFGAYNRAKSLAQQLLVFSKGGAPIRKIQSIADHVQKCVSFALSGSNVHAFFTMPEEEVWPCDFDENQMAQVFDNIVINARQAMPLGGRLDVAIRNLSPADAPEEVPFRAYIHVSIRDHGSGITKEHLPRIFDPFFTTKQLGSGLGLATSYSIVKQHEGLIAIESELGAGTTCHVYLPASSGQIPCGEAEKEKPHHGDGRILIMDDEAFIIDIASEMFEGMGYHLVTAEDGDEAIRHARSAKESGQPFRMAILDLTIPGGRGGKDTVSALLEIDPDIKVVASSGYSEDPVMANPSAYGFAGRLVKPYCLSDLNSLLELLLGHIP